MDNCSGRAVIEEPGSTEKQDKTWAGLRERPFRSAFQFLAGHMLSGYHGTPTDTSWKDCDLRAWLNREFLEMAFTPVERAKITAVRVENLRSAKYYTNAGLNTMDRVYVLSVAEAEKYLPTEAERAGDGWWWLRSPGSNLFSAVAVYDDGTLYEFGIHIHYENGGARPVMWVLLK